MSTPRPIEGGSYIADAAVEGGLQLKESTGDPECNCQLTEEQKAAKQKAQDDAEAAEDFVRAASPAPTEQIAKVPRKRVTNAIPEA